VQGYFFSKPVPPQAFDRFLIERTNQKTEITPTDKKSYMSISKALTSDFESIFYVDVLTDFYLEFHTGKNGELEIRPGGVDFFSDIEEKLLADVAESDREKLREALGKTNLLRWVGRQETVEIPFLKMKNGVPTPCLIQTIKSRESDTNHIVLGVKEEKGGKA